MLSVRIATWLVAAALGSGAVLTAPFGAAGVEQAPPPASPQEPIPISGEDRLYTADQTSNTVTVADPSTNTTLGTIALGDQRLGSTMSPQYLGDAGVHGLATSPDGNRLAVVAVSSNTVHIVDTATNEVLSTTDVGRAAHEGSFTTDGKEFWVADRGRDTVTIVDAVHGGVVGRVRVGDGPSKVLMSPDGRWAYVNFTTMSEIAVINVHSRKVKDRITGLGDSFSSDQSISPDGTELWAAHKRVGKVSVVDLAQREVTTVLETGPDTNHPQFVDTTDGSYVYLTMGGLDETWVYSRGGAEPELVTRIKNSGHAPHGAWPSGDSTRMYVGLEKSDGIDVIDTATHQVVDTIETGQEPQAVAYASKAAEPGSAANLGTQGLGQRAHNVPTILPDGTRGDTLDPEKGRVLEATVRPVAGLDMIQIQARRLRPNTMYQAYSVAADGRKTPVFAFQTDDNGGTPMALAFASFDGKSIAITPQGEVTPVQKAAFAAQSGSHGHTTTADDLVFCTCC
ncbi:40-residue YVTN family beta-propeller repeat-containing protein [Promicromonospora umidemergens]|uniref:Beta-propeller fold lactonase family protein n=1 Tax=Promicromonospora umidemergens TaxID=629679 RepID=A0ABP8X628_9MICO|nr:LpqB family beta-propeller domain-containing protein [Promicromonospora umidemergens]MCP2281170.1 40-residue YVTN family beta-propeller repeat-containing protein [Promicromonospora umidemergens]